LRLSGGSGADQAPSYAARRFQAGKFRKWPKFFIEPPEPPEPPANKGDCGKTPASGAQIAGIVRFF